MARGRKYTFIDLFSGAGGLSEGFIEAGIIPIALVEMDNNACQTLKTRLVYHLLKELNKSAIYEDHLFSRSKGYKSSSLWDKVPKFDTYIM